MQLWFSRQTTGNITTPKRLPAPILTSSHYLRQQMITNNSIGRTWNPNPGYNLCLLRRLQNTAAGGNLGFRNTGKDHWCEMKMPELVYGYKKLPNFNGIDFGAGFIDNGDGTENF
jgi:hypothetical protein